MAWRKIFYRGSNERKEDIMRGKIIVIEGGEGCGKSTQADMLRNYLGSKGYDVYLGREPGGINSAEEMRRILKNPEYSISPISELFGFNFARSEFYDKVVIPKLEKGFYVLLDRSGWSTEAYQGYAGGIDLETIRHFNHISTRGNYPDLGIIIDIDPRVGLEKEVERDRISNKGLDFHTKVREGFLKIAEENEDVCYILDYIPRGQIKMHESIVRIFEDLLI